MELNSSDSSRILLAQTTFAVSVVLFALKYWAYYLTNSQVVLSDALETIVNILAAVIALWVVRWAAQPADEDHPYGHGKAELLSAMFEGSLIFSAAVFIFIQAVVSFFKPPELTSLGVGLYITTGAAVINGVLGWVLIVQGKNMRSSALEASGHHLLSDVITSAGAVLGLAGVAFTGYALFDSLAAAIVSLYLLYTGFRLMRSSIGGLMDKKDPEALQKFNTIINQQRREGIIQIHHVRMLISGGYFHVDAHVVIPEYWDVKKAHQATQKYEKEVFHYFKVKGEAHFHIDPCEQNYCEQCADKNCPIRLKPFKNYRNISIEEMMDAEEPIKNETV